MTPKRLRSILDGLDDLSEFVLAASLELVEETGDLLLADWRAAASEADAAYAEWRRRRDRASYAIYRACADRADAAQDALAARATEGRHRSGRA
jgi:acyl-CoA reductase-like NAD-dependent aldehyde dehydrogenase